MPAIDVHLDAGLRVDGEPLVRVDGHTEKTGVRLDTDREKRAKNETLDPTCSLISQISTQFC